MSYSSFFILALTTLLLSCKPSSKLSKDQQAPAAAEDKAAKLTSDHCIDPDLSKVASDQSFMLCDGTIASGTYTPPTPDYPDVANVLTTDTVNGVLGTYTPLTPDPWDLRYGVSVGATTGRLKMNCRNMVGTYDKADGPASAGVDRYDTIDDSNDFGPLPLTNPWGSDEYFCGFNDPADPTWELVTASGSNSVYKDKITNLKWSRGSSTITRDWDNDEGDDADNDGALEYCESLDHEGISTWRLPTQKELMAAYEHGIYDLDDGHTATNNLGNLAAIFWSSSTRSEGLNKDNAWIVYLHNGFLSLNFKTNGLSVLCVSP